MAEFLTALFGILALIVLCIYVDVKRQRPDLPTESQAGETFEAEATVLDGDTVRVPALEMDLRRDAPEKGRHGAERAEDALAEKLDTADRIDMELVEEGKWGRPVVELWADGENVSDWLLEEGLAERY